MKIGPVCDVYNTRHICVCIHVPEKQLNPLFNNMRKTNFKLK